MESRVTIKQISHPDNPKLSAKYIGAKEYATPKTGKDGKIITGVDENAFSIISLKEENVKKKSKEVKDERESLERLLNVDLTPGSEFWTKFYITLEDERILDVNNPLDRLHEKFLLANKYVAPSRESIESDPEFYNCMFYIHRDVEETTKKARLQRNKDKASTALYNLSEDQPNKLQLVSAFIFGYEPQEVSVDEAYIKLKEFIEVPDEKERQKNIETLMSVVSKTPEQLTTKKIFDKAIKKRYVTGKGGIFKRGDEIYGNNYDEALEFLGLPENSSELISLKKQVEKG
jgi:hypothetical protein